MATWVAIVVEDMETLCRLSIGGDLMGPQQRLLVVSADLPMPQATAPVVTQWVASLCQGG